MHATRTAVPRQHSRINTYRTGCDSYSFFNLLTSEVLLDKVEELLPGGHRERLYPPTETLSLFLAQAMNLSAHSESSRAPAAGWRAINR